MADGQTRREDSRAHWEGNPCGIHLPLGAPDTKEFYERLRRFKYEVDYPEILRFVRFHEWRDRRVLEIGCGLGSDSQTWLENGARLTSIDFARRAVESTRHRLGLFGHSFTPVQASALALPFADGTFDLVYSWGVLMHTGDTRLAIREACRVVTPGGTVILMLYNRNSLLFRLYVRLLGRKFDDDAPIVDFHTNAEMREMLDGMRIVEMENYYFLRPNVSRLGRLLPRRLETVLGKTFGACTYVRAIRPLPA